MSEQITLRRVQRPWLSGWSAWRCFWWNQAPGRYVTVGPDGKPFRLVRTRRAGWTLNGEPVEGVHRAREAIGEATRRVRAGYVPDRRRRTSTQNERSN
ncbi:hypothetical protein [Streptomyces yaizuensis]|uniref:Uncharacterized protein n=1 Tax=Streptomyces yaizuensis TaxID=2989713 RepID=A0AA86M7B1_9ACTN|nr:hypothetical protein [Streptomyces sp. YSPA8]BDT39566.1 hypothetical protein SYYSPA8_37240 [Streptomyces sp. YSPA8]